VPVLDRGGCGRGGDSVREGREGEGREGEGREGEGAGGGTAEAAGAGAVSVAGNASEGGDSSLLPEAIMRMTEPNATTAANPRIRGTLDERRSFRLSVSSSSSYAAGDARSVGMRPGGAIRGAEEIGAVTASCAAPGGEGAATPGAGTDEASASANPGALAAEATGAEERGCAATAGAASGPAGGGTA